MIGYKLTTQDMTTHGGFKWRRNQWRRAKGEGTSLCSDGVLHYHEHPALALLLNPIHANIYAPRLWECEIKEPVANDGLKSGCKSMRLTRELPLPVITTEQRVEFAIRVMMHVYRDERFLSWAEKWLSGDDRTYVHARTYAADADADAANAAAHAAAHAADYAAHAAARAAYTAAHVASPTILMSVLDTMGLKEINNEE